MPKALSLLEQKALKDFLTKLGAFLETDRIQRSQSQHAPVKKKRIFISYAWEADPAKNTDLQNWLRQLASHLEAAGFQVYLDVKCISGSIEAYMTKKLQKSDFALIICTPRLKDRADSPTPNNLQIELNAINQSQSLDFIPLLLEGDFQTAFPAKYNFQRNICLDFTAESYISLLTDCEGRRGLIPTLCNVHPMPKPGNVLDTVYPIFYRDLRRSLSLGVAMQSDPELPLVTEGVVTAMAGAGGAGSGGAISPPELPPVEVIVAPPVVPAVPPVQRPSQPKPMHPEAVPDQPDQHNQQPVKPLLSAADHYREGNRLYDIRAYESAWKHYDHAAELGEFRAYTNLGVMLLQGDGRVVDGQAALGYFAKAADRGHARAMFNLGVMYETGQGVARDLGLARSWYQKGDLAGDRKSRERLAGMEKVEKIKP